MKREILFRGQRVDNGEWIYGGISIFHGLVEIFDSNSIDNSCYEVIPETVGQFTGLTDKNGVKIFEGDICKFETCSSKYQRKEVEYYKWGFFVGDYPVGENCEIIGNIHDNPELLS